QRYAQLFIDDGQPTLTRFGDQYPWPLASELARQTARQLQRLRPSAGEVGVVDAVDLVALNGAPVGTPEENWLSVEKLANGGINVGIIPRSLTFGEMIRDAYFRIALWHVILPAVFCMLTPWLPDETAP